MRFRLGHIHPGKSPAPGSRRYPALIALACMAISAGFGGGASGEPLKINGLDHAGNIHWSQETSGVPVTVELATNLTTSP